jgi:hypothetical protein
MVRHPYWVANGSLVVKCNGKKINIVSKSSSYLAISRVWKNGDKVEISLPMKTRIEQLPNVPQYIAIMHGPIVLGAKTGTEDLAGLVADDNRWGHIAHGKLLPVSKAPVIVGGRTEIASKLIPVKGKPFHFTTKNLFNNPEYSNLELQPFFTIHDARYMMYWLSLSENEYKRTADSLGNIEKTRLALDARTIDAIVPGEQQPEADHKVKMEKTNSALFKDAYFREVQSGGTLSYQLFPKNESNLKLLVRYWGNEWGKRSFKIYINDSLLVAENIVGKWNKQQFVDVEYLLPDTLTTGKEQITVRFEPENGNSAGGLFYIALVRK